MVLFSHYFAILEMIQMPVQKDINNNAIEWVSDADANPHPQDGPAISIDHCDR